MRQLKSKAHMTAFFAGVLRLGVQWKGMVISMKIAVFPGSFDPVTLGHIDILHRAAAIFDKVYICAMANGEKKSGMFTAEERLEMLRGSVTDLPNVEADIWNGLLTDYAKQKDAKYLVKGVRNGSDFDSEYSLALINRGLDGELETVLLCAAPQYMHFSSTMAREMIKYHQDLKKYVPAYAADYMKKRGY